MRISSSKSKNTVNFYIIKDYTKNGKRTTRHIDKIGNLEKITELAKKEGIDYKEWLNNYLNKYISEHSDHEEILIKRNSGKIIPKNQKNLFNVGYLFLQDIYYDLRLNHICHSIEDKYLFKFDLNEILSYLIYSRIIYPSSKLKTHELSKHFLEVPNIKLENIYRGLTYLNKEIDYIQEKVFENSLKVIDRNSRVIYFDCTNYYFEINEEDDLRRYGISKEHKPNPLVGMGLFMDGDGIPLSFNIYPGNNNETQELIPTEEKIINNFKLNDTRIVICTDAAMCTDDIKKFNVKDGRSFVITQSIKKLKEEYQKEVFKKNDWRIVGDNNLYNIEEISNNEELSNRYYDTLSYKIIPTETKSVKQDLIITYSLKYRDYHQKLRNNKIERAKKKIENNPKNDKISLNHNQNDYRRFIKEMVSTKNGEKAEQYFYEIDEEMITEEEKYDGYYGLTTNLNDDIETILKISKGRWEIEESFQIMKSDLIARPVNLQREDRITAHFLTCFLSLLIYRILEKKLNYKYTSTKIFEGLKNMMVLELKGDGYIPAYERTNLTDDLHEVFGFRTDFEIISYKKYKKIFEQTKNKKLRTF